MKRCEHEACPNEIAESEECKCSACGHYFCKNHSVSNICLPTSMQSSSDSNHFITICSRCCNSHYYQKKSRDVNNEELIATLTNDLTYLSSEKARLQQENLVILEDNKTLLLSKEELVHIKTSGETEILELKTEIQRLNDELTYKETTACLQCSDIRDDIAALISNHDTQLELQKNEIKRLQVELQHAHHTIPSLKEQLSLLTAAHDKDIKHHEQNEHRVKQLTSVVEQKDGELIEHQQRNVDSLAAIDTLSSQLDALQYDHTQLKAECAILRTRIQELETALSEANDHIHELESTVESLNESIIKQGTAAFELTSERDASCGRVSELEWQLEQVTASKEVMARELSEALDLSTDLHAENLVFLETVQRMESEQRREREEQEKVAASIATDLAVANGKLAESEGEVLQLRAQLMGSVKTSAEEDEKYMKSRLAAEYERKRAELQRQIESKQQECDQVAADLHELTTSDGTSLAGGGGTQDSNSGHSSHSHAKHYSATLEQLRKGHQVRQSVLQTELNTKTAELGELRDRLAELIVEEKE